MAHRAVQVRLADAPGLLPLRYLADRMRHLVCEPYSREGLLAMADDLGIGRHWLHGGRLAHIDIPQRDVARILRDSRVAVVSPREVLAVVRGAQS